MLSQTTNACKRQTDLCIYTDARKEACKKKKQERASSSGQNLSR